MSLETPKTKERRMMKVEWRKVPGGEDKDREAFVDGVRVAYVMRGWLRNGGWQWCVTGGEVGSNWGAKTLKNIETEIQARLTR